MSRDDVKIHIAADASRLGRGTSEASRTVQNFERQTQQQLRRAEGHFQSLSTVARRALGVLGVGFGAAQFRSFISNAVAAADEIDKLSARIGLSTDAVQEFTHATDLSGVSMGQFEQAVRELNRRIAEGTQPYRDAEQALAAIADRVQAAGSAAERARIVYDAFGRTGASLLPMLQDGAAGLAAMRQEARDLGLVLSADTIQAATQLNDELSRMMRVLRTNAQAGLLRGLVRETGDLRDIYTDPNFQSGAQIFGETLGFIASEAGSAVRSIGLLAQILRDPSLENLQELLTEGGSGG